MNSFVSVIICTCNRAGLLKRALRSLMQQSIPQKHYEVIVVDDGSVDDTLEVSKDMRSELPNLRYFSTGTTLGLAQARNIGINLSVGDYLLFTDDDCIVAEDWIECLISALNAVPIVAGAVTSMTANYFKLCHNISQFYAFMPGRKAGPIGFLPGANMAFRRSILKYLQGFQAGIRYADDMDFILRARSEGYQALFVPDAVVIHDPDRTALIGILRHSAGHASVTILLRNKYQVLLGTPFILQYPALLLALSPIIALKVTAGIYLQNLKTAKLFWTAPMVYLLKLAWCWGAARGLREQNNTVRKP